VAKATDEILAACLEELQAGTATIDGCLHRYPEIAAELGPLLHLALALQPTEDLVLSPEFRVAARQRLLDAMASTASPEPRETRNSLVQIHSRRLAAVLAQCVDDVLAGRASVAACLTNHSDIASELEQPLRLTTSLLPVDVAGPSQEFQTRSRQDLLATISPARTSSVAVHPRSWFQGPSYETVLAACVDDVRAGRVSLQGSLARYPRLAVRLEPELRMALSLPTVDAPGPSSAFERRARRDLLASISTASVVGTSSVPGISRAPKIEEVLAACIDVVTSGRMSVRGCLARYASLAAELEPLLRLALSVPRVDEASKAGTPSPEFRRHVRQVLLTNALVRPAPSRVGPMVVDRPRPSHLAAWRGASLAMTTVLVTMTTYAWQFSVPGDALYGLKRTTEGVLLMVAPTDDARERLLLGAATHRADEIQKVAQTADPAVVKALANSYADAAQKAADLSTRKAQPNSIVAGTLQRQEDQLKAAAAIAPPATQAAVHSAVIAAQASVESVVSVSTPIPHSASVAVGPEPTPTRSIRAAATAPAPALAPTTPPPTAIPPVAVAPAPVAPIILTVPPTATAVHPTATVVVLPPRAVAPTLVVTPSLPPGAVAAPALPTMTPVPAETPTPRPTLVPATPTLPPFVIPSPVPPRATSTPTMTATATATATATVTGTTTASPTVTGTPNGRVGTPVVAIHTPTSQGGNNRSRRTPAPWLTSATPSPVSPTASPTP